MCVKSWPAVYLEQNVNGKAGALWGQLSFHHGLLGGCIHKCCFPSTLPVEINIQVRNVIQVSGSTHQRRPHWLVKPTCDRPKWTDAVSDMYIIFPSGATTKMKPSNVWKKQYKKCDYTKYKLRSSKIICFLVKKILSWVHLHGQSACITSSDIMIVYHRKLSKT